MNRVETAKDSRTFHERAIAEIGNCRSRLERTRTIEAWIDHYIGEYGRRPRSGELELLADLLLREELADSNPHKSSQQEYPILSDLQLKRRRRGRGMAAASNMRGEIGLDPFGGQAEGEPVHRYLAADGRIWRRPTRRKRSLYEVMWMDGISTPAVAESCAVYCVDAARMSGGNRPERTGKP